MRKVEFALAQYRADPPRLLVETISDPNRALSSYIICDIYQVVYLLVNALVSIGKPGKPTHTSRPVVRIQLRPTALQFKKTDPIENVPSTFILFQATAFVISQDATHTEVLPKVKECYGDKVDGMASQESPQTPPLIDLQQQIISSIVEAHYCYWEAFGDEQHMLLVLPNDVTDIFNNITAKLPIDCLTSEALVTPKEPADSMMALMQFHDCVCKSSYREDPIDIGMISCLLLLLRKRFGFKRHVSGELFYVRAIGITQLVVEWVFHSPKVIYASLLFGLVRHTCLPLSYVREHYNLGVYAFVLNLVKIDQRQALDHPSLLYVQNRLRKALKENHVQLSILFIKLTERLYDLRHVSGYIHPVEVQHMAQGTLSVDVQLAKAYLDTEIGVALEEAAKQALEVGRDIDKQKDKAKEFADADR